MLKSFFITMSFISILKISKEKDLWFIFLKLSVGLLMIWKFCKYMLQKIQKIQKMAVKKAEFQYLFKMYHWYKVWTALSIF